MPPSERPKTDRKRKAAAPAVGFDSVNDSPRVSESDIALKAFAYYCERGYQDGRRYNGNNRPWWLGIF